MDIIDKYKSPSELAFETSLIGLKEDDLRNAKESEKITISDDAKAIVDAIHYLVEAIDRLRLSL